MMQGTKDRPTVGVVIISFNNSQFLRECVLSVINQSYKPKTIVICDDASTDKSLDIINDLYKQFPEIILPITHKENLGISKNINSGLKALETDFVSVVAGDDVWHKDKLVNELDALKESVGSRWAYSKIRSVNKEGQETGDFTRYDTKQSGDLLFQVLAKRIRVFNWLMEKNLIEEIGLYDENLDVSEDFEYTIRLSSSAKGAFSNKFNVFYRRHSNNITSGSLNNFIKARRKIYEKHKKSIEKLSRDKKMYVLMIRYLHESDGYFSLFINTKQFKDKVKYLYLGLKYKVLQLFYKSIRKAGSHQSTPCTRV